MLTHSYCSIGSKGLAQPQNAWHTRMRKKMPCTPRFRLNIFISIILLGKVTPITQPTPLGLSQNENKGTIATRQMKPGTWLIRMPAHIIPGAKVRDFVKFQKKVTFATRQRNFNSQVLVLLKGGGTVTISHVLPGSSV